MKKLFSFCLLFLPFVLISQTSKEIAWEKAKEAIQLMDNGKIEKSIKILKECEKLDPKEYTYPYEIAFAYVLKKDYKRAIKILNKVKKYENINSQVYQMLGNCYSYEGNPKKAIKTYEEGMKLFPKSGNLHLEKGNVYLGLQDYTAAVTNYKKGIEVEPMFPSNYYNIAVIYLSTNNKLNGLIYGEIFMNLERTTERTQNMSLLLLETYEKAIQFEKDETKIDFCEIILDAQDLEKEDIKLPLCASFGKNFILATVGEQEVNLSSISRMRTKFIELFFKEDYKEYPNVLFEYQKKLLDQNMFEAYNHYLFQIGEQEDFNLWLDANDEEFEAFIDWYKKDTNIISITTENKYLE